MKRNMKLKESNKLISNEEIRNEKVSFQGNILSCVANDFLTPLLNNFKITSTNNQTPKGSIVYYN